MQARARFMLAVVVLFLLMTGPFLLTALIVWVETEGEARDLLLKVLSPHLTLGTLLTAMGFAAGVGVVRVLFRQYVQGLLRMSENLRLMLGANRGFRVHPEGPPEVQQLAVATNELASQRDVLLQDVEAQIGRAKASVELEKDRLAALMSELTQSVVVCNLDGRVLLYNNRARAQFRALSDAPGVAGGGELIGLGRSIYGVFERNLIAHALDTIQQRLRRGAAQAQANFVTTTRAGQLLRVQMAPVLSLAAPALVAAESTAVAAGSVTGVQQNAAAEGDGAGNAGGGASPAAPEVAAAAVTSERTLTGFILMLDNITRNFETESRRDQMLHNLTEGNRASLANVRAAADMLEFEDLTDEMRTRFRKVVRDEVQAMSQRLDHTANEFADSLKARWPLEEMLGADLIAAAQRRIEARIGLPTKLEEVDESLWVKVDSFSLIQAITYLASRLSDEFEVREVRFRLSAAGRLVHLDLIWSGQAMSTETVMSLGARTDEDRGREQPAHRARRGRPPWRRDVVRAREGCATVPSSASCCRRPTPQEQAEAETALRGREPSRVLRLRSLRVVGEVARTRRPPAQRAATRSSTPRPPGSTPRRATRSSRSAPPASSTASLLQEREHSSSWWTRAVRCGPSRHSHPWHHLGDAARPADHRQGAASLPCLLRGHRAGRAQRRLRHALPATQGGGDRHLLRQPVLDTLLLSAVIHPEPGIAQAGSDLRAPRHQRHRPPHRAGRRHRHRRSVPQA
jgi:DNA polymerase-3 subunit epsilon